MGDACDTVRLGHSLRWIAEELGTSKSTVERYTKPKAKKKKEKAAGK
jgi:DNA-binding CsgD family transcriptional regulator